MLLNTRNFLLYLLAVGFLIVGITTTALSRPGEQAASVIMGIEESGETEYVAEAVAPTTLNRAERIAEMRGKIAAHEDVASVPVAAVTEPEPVAETNPGETPAPLVVEQCSTYAVFTGEWQSGAVTFTVAEGARLVTREVMTTSTNASGTVVTVPDTEVLLQLPLRSQPLPSMSCLPTDVVGIASDGSLIRNGEVALYGVFGSDTLIGYALDGFPIYGVSATATLDVCGGTSELGQYRYFLRPGQSHILNCFAGTPIEM